MLVILDHTDADRDNNHVYSPREGWGGRGGCHIFIWKSLEESCNCKRRKSSCRQAVKEEFLSWDLLRRFMSAGPPLNKSSIAVFLLGDLISADRWGQP